MRPRRARSTPWPRLAVAGLWACAVACGAEGPAGEGAAAAAGAEAEIAPDFTLPTLGGGEITLSELRGKTVVIDFWATWCPPCEFQIPVLNEVYRSHRERGVEVLGVSVDVDGFEVVRPYAKRHGIGYPVLLGTEALARRFGAPGFPALVVVAPGGEIARVHVGLIEKAELETILGELAGDGQAPADPA